MAPVETIAEVQEKLDLVQKQLVLLDSLKKKEGALRKEEADLAARLEELESAKEFFGKDEDGWDEVPKKKSGKTAALTFSSPAVNAVMASTVAASAEDQRKKRLKAINKKLSQITDLKSKGLDNLDDEQLAKVYSQGKLEKEKATLQAGLDWDSAAEETEDEGRRALPEEESEREKRIKVLQKKLKQIADLRAKPSAELDAEARDKIAGEVKLKQELAALEGGQGEVVYDETEIKIAEKVEAEKKLKAVKKKVAQIAHLKESKEAAEYTEDEKVKIAGEKALKKEVNELEQKIASYNREERERVAARLGWEVENNKKKKNGKK
eukprot:TRINITY_DN2052_c0_g1_i7.p1 TRINITY_DN2052_c0_g1~~TRINITY_DN2052_c0_g1_i7.p1  ORF type:complete len:356 (-),score=169.46 TRINITY_DN2052_c0_g1_i7:321-1289(-)